MGKRWLAVCLCLALTVTMLSLPIQAWDSDGQTDDSVIYIPEKDVAPGEVIGVSNPLLAAGPSTYDDANPRPLRSGETLRRGIDVSAWQENIDWKKVADSGVEFAIIKVCGRGYGMAGSLYEDSKFRRNIEGAQANGILVGAYVFSQAITVTEARQEARYLISLIQDYDMDLPLVLDYEEAYANGDRSTGRLSNALDTWLTPEDVTKICLAFCEEVEDYGYESMVYTYKYFFERKMKAGALSRVWLAHFVSETNYEGDYEFWQFSSSGAIPGISGDVDKDFWFDAGTTKGPYRAYRPVDMSVEDKPDPELPEDPEEPDAPDVPVRVMNFPDVRPGDWFYSAVKAAYEREIVNGNDLGTFDPLGKVSRGQMVTMLYRMAGSPAVSGRTRFLDLDQDYYKKAVLWAWQTGVMGGYYDDTFAPADNMTRQDLAVVLYRMEGRPAISGNLVGYRDFGETADYARSAMIWAVKNGLLEGAYGELRPRSGCTRAEACAILIRYLENIA